MVRCGLMLISLIALGDCGQVWHPPWHPETIFNNSIAHNITTMRSLSIGDSNFSTYTGKLIMTDCILPGCTPKTGGRRLIHGGGSPITAPAGWYPDPSMPNTDFCDLTTMFSKAKITQAISTHGGIWAVTTIAWIGTCITGPRSNAAYLSIPAAGFPAILIGVPGSVATSFQAYYHASNPLPTTKVCWGYLPNGTSSESALGRELTILMYGLNIGATTVGYAPYTQFNLNIPFLTSKGPYAGEATWAIPNLTHSGPPSFYPANFSIYVRCTNDDDVDYAYMMSFGNIFSWRFAAALQLIVVFWSIVQLVLLGKKGKLCTWPAFVMLMEGMLASVFRAWRNIDILPYLWTGNFDVPVSHWLMRGAEMPWSNSSTFATVYVWARIVFFRGTSKTADIVAFAFCLCLLGIFLWLGLMYGIQNWTKFPPNSTPQQVLDFSVYPGAILTAAFAFAFVIISLVAIAKLAMLSKVSASVKATLRFMLPWILVQVVGLVLLITANFVEIAYHFTGPLLRPEPKMTNFAFHALAWGGFLTSFGQVGALSKGSSSSSSSSS